MLGLKSAEVVAARCATALLLLYDASYSVLAWPIKDRMRPAAGKGAVLSVDGGSTLTLTKRPQHWDKSTGMFAGTGRRPAWPWPVQLASPRMTVSAAVAELIAYRAKRTKLPCSPHSRMKNLCSAAGGSVSLLAECLLPRSSASAACLLCREGRAGWRCGRDCPRLVQAARLGRHSDSADSYRQLRRFLHHYPHTPVRLGPGGWVD